MKCHFNQDPYSQPVAKSRHGIQAL